MISTERENAMNEKPFAEQDLLEDLDAESAHADELATPLPQELSPLERLKGSVKRTERPTVPVWYEYFDSSEGASDDFMQDREQPPMGW
jgi:antitoxin VapB